jgi:fumarylacetoacetate (FAA) hydrolase
MKLLTFVLPESPRQTRLGALVKDSVVDLEVARRWAQGARGIPAQELPATMLELIHTGRPGQEYVGRVLEALDGKDPTQLKGPGRAAVAYPRRQVYLYPPLPRPLVLRDFYAFEQHVRSAYEIRDRAVPPEWYEFPVYYYCNPNTVFGPEETIPHPGFTEALDYELEVACILGQAGRDLTPEQAAESIFGYCILNDWSARDVQRREMRAGLGPAKGKDFATSLGPWIVTPDELSDRAAGRAGVYDLAMIARVNGTERSRGSWSALHYSFGEMIARASQDVYLLPGEVFGSGTVGSGCLLELTRGQGPWLQPGDVVELEIERLGVLRNRIGERTRTPSPISGTKDQLPQAHAAQPDA